MVAVAHHTQFEVGKGCHMVELLQEGEEGTAATEMVRGGLKDFMTGQFHQAD